MEFMADVNEDGEFFARVTNGGVADGRYLCRVWTRNHSIASS